MPIHKVHVKWNKQIIDVDLNSDDEPRVFKAQLYAITNVPVFRQKILFKGKQIQDDSWGDLKLKDGVTLLMMGSQDDIPKAPEVKTVFMEDLTENKLTQLLNLPAGLENLGNTCYINATVQCLKTVPEFVKKVRQNEMTSSSSLLTQVLKNVFDLMDNFAVVDPSILVSTLLKAVPRFAENQQNGVFQQQDANECWTELLRLIRSDLKPIENSLRDENSPKYDSFIDQYFGGVNEVTLKCTECEDEEPTLSKDNFLQLSCFINSEIKYLSNGLKARLEEQITKHSPKLKRDAIYTKSNRISRLPSYLSVQMVRYIYKERESINAKILKDIKFPISLDVYDLCSTDLQQKLLPMRLKFKEEQDRQCEIKVSLATSGGDAETKDKQDKKEEDKYIYPNYFENDLGSNNSGYYELQAVLTHKGRSSSSGHYVAWIKGKKDEWFKCDDDDITPVCEEEILKLSGGGDWHCAYVLLYGSKQLAVEKKADGSPAF